MEKPQLGISAAPQLKAWHDALIKLFPTEQEKIVVISTQMSCAMDIIEFLGTLNDFVAIPPQVKYRMAILLNHYFCIVNAHQGQDLSTIDKRSATFPYVKDFSDEIVQKRLAYVVKILYEECEEMGLYGDKSD